MSDELIKRLTDAAPIAANGHILTEAAQTIERLTRELDAARKSSAAWREFAEHQSWCADCAESVSSCPRGQKLHVAAISATTDGGKNETNNV